MRDPERIPKILAEIESVWRKMPDMRLGQLIISAAGNPFMLEDEDLVQRLHNLCESVD